MEDQLYGIAIIPFIMYIIQGLKGVGLKDDWAPLASLGVGVLFAAVIDLAYGGTAPEALLSAVLHGLTAGAAAGGVYSGIHQLEKPARVLRG